MCAPTLSGGDTTDYIGPVCDRILGISRGLSPSAPMLKIAIPDSEMGYSYSLSSKA
jgi:hypothetical protein